MNDFPLVNQANFWWTIHVIRFLIKRHVPGHTLELVLSRRISNASPLSSRRTPATQRHLIGGSAPETTPVRLGLAPPKTKTRAAAPHRCAWPSGSWPRASTFSAWCRARPLGLKRRKPYEVIREQGFNVWIPLRPQGRCTVWSEKRFPWGVLEKYWAWGFCLNLWSQLAITDQGGFA